MNTIMRGLEQEGLKKDIPSFGPGDTVKVHIKLIEGDRERIQVFEGDVIRIRRGDIRSTFTVRKTSYGVGVERIFPLHSPVISKIEVIRKGVARRAKLYYLRDRRGKSAKLKEKRTKVVETAKVKKAVVETKTPPEKEVAPESEAVNEESSE